MVCSWKEPVKRLAVVINKPGIKHRWLNCALKIQMKCRISLEIFRFDLELGLDWDLGFRLVNHFMMYQIIRETLPSSPHSSMSSRCSGVWIICLKWLSAWIVCNCIRCVWMSDLKTKNITFNLLWQPEKTSLAFLQLNLTLRNGRNG